MCGISQTLPAGRVIIEPMDVLVTITVIDDEGDEIANVSASAHTPFADWSELPAEAFRLALQHLELSEG